MGTTIIHYILPTVNKDLFYKNVISKLSMYSCLKDYISFGINFQPPWKMSEIKDVERLFKESGIDIRWIFNTYENRGYDFPLVKIRDDAASLNKEARYFCSIDDDIEYTCSDLEYANIIASAIEYCERYDIGAFMLGQPISKRKEDYHREIPPMEIHKENSIWTGLGLILRNVFNGHINHDSFLNKWGTQEDVSEGASRLLYNNLGIVSSSVDSIGIHTEVKEWKDKLLKKS